MYFSSGLAERPPRDDMLNINQTLDAGGHNDDLADVKNSTEDIHANQHQPATDIMPSMQNTLGLNKNDSASSRPQDKIANFYGP